MGDLSAISKSEIQNAEFTVRDAQRLFVERLDEHGATAILENGKLIAVVLASKPEHGVSGTMFMAKEPFFAGSAPTRFLRRWVRATLADMPLNTVLRSETWSQHPRVCRWYELLGYTKVSEFGLGKRFELAHRDASPNSIEGAKR
jgi:hypothetical protein